MHDQPHDRSALTANAATQPATDPAAYWSRPAEILLSQLGSSAEGLSPEEARARLKRDGANVVRPEAAISGLGLLLRQFRNPLVLILIFAGALSGGLRQWVDASVILAMILVSTLIGFGQEYRASQAVSELRRRLQLTARVRRAGTVVSLPFAEIVPGDVVLLCAGAVVPADGVVLSAKDLLISEASLTGESFPTEKRAGAQPVDTPLSARSNCVFLGTSVRSGTGEVLVVATGRTTEFGEIAEQLKRKPIETDFGRSVRLFGFLLIRVMTAIVLFVLIVNQVLGRPFIDSLLFSVALGLGMSPELLPAIVSVTLARGARRLAAKGVIVRQLEAIENLGGMTVFCTDKTGTLTEGRITLVEAVGPDGQASPAVRRLGFLNAAFETGIENPLDRAILDDGRAAGLDAGGCEKLDEIPYDFARKRLAIVLADSAEGALMVVKGAFDTVLPLCTTLATPTGEAPLRAEAASACRAFYAAKGDEGLRLLAVATRRLPLRPRYDLADEAQMRLEGFLIFLDPPKPDAAAALRDLAELGVAVKVISGDNRYVVRHVADEVGLKDVELVTGAELAQMKDEALSSRAQRTTLFAEVDPQQKVRIVRALQRRGGSVGFLGDGINDAPALYAADVGISVDQAVDVARESADIVLLRRDLRVLRQGIEDGRRTFANTLKYISITTSANFGNMVSMALATPVLPFLPMVAKQILLNNFLSDLPAMAISTDAVDRERLVSALRLDVGEIQRFMVVFGLISSIFDLTAFVVLFAVFHAPERIFQTAWFLLSLLTELAVILVLRTRGPFWRSRPGAALTWIAAAVGVLALAAPYAGGLAGLFDLEPLRPAVVGAVAVLVVGYLVATEAAKRWYFHRRGVPGPS